jgi:hypothetical protein
MSLQVLGKLFYIVRDTQQVYWPRYIEIFVAVFTPAIITAAVFWARAGDSDGLSITEAFISLALVALVSTPVAELVGGRAVFSGALACLKRIQEFLLLEDKDVYQQQGGGT